MRWHGCNKSESEVVRRRKLTCGFEVCVRTTLIWICTAIKPPPIQNISSAFEISTLVHLADRLCEGVVGDSAQVEQNLLDRCSMSAKLHSSQNVMVEVFRSQQANSLERELLWANHNRKFIVTALCFPCIDIAWMNRSTLLKEGSSWMGGVHLCLVIRK